MWLAFLHESQPLYNVLSNFLHLVRLYERNLATPVVTVFSFFESIAFMCSHSGCFPTNTSTVNPFIPFEGIDFLLKYKDFSRLEVANAVLQWCEFREQCQTTQGTVA